MEVGGGYIIYLLLHCHHQNDACIKMDSDESQFHCERQGHKRCPQVTTSEEKGELKQI